MAAISIEALAGAVAGAALGYGVYEGLKYVEQHADNALAPEVVEEEKDEEKKGERQKTADVYAPDRPLPNGKNDVKTPDTDAAHTQLGTRNGKKGKYAQGREFDENGEAIHDIDFTDHGRAHDHTNPHQHIWKQNSTGGSKSRDHQKPVAGWIYE